MFAQYVQETVRQCQDRRARVLAHPEIAARLTRPPFTFKFPEQWGGYIPPKVIERGGQLVENPSPQRRALIEICNAVVEAERRQVVAPPATETAEPAEPDPELPTSRVTERQLKHLHIRYADAGITDRDNKLAFASEVTGRPIESTRDLSRIEAAHVISAINTVINHHEEEPPR